MHKTRTTLLLAALLLLAGVALAGYGWSQKLAPAAHAPAAEYKNLIYTIDGQPTALVDGRAESSAAPGSASKVVTRYFGNEATGDVDGDGVADTAFILTQDAGGSGTFYYVVAAVKTPTGYRGTNAVLLGDRIAPQTTQVEYGQVVVNYAERAAGEPMTVAPSVGVSKYLRVVNGVLVEISASEQAAGK